MQITMDICTLLFKALPLKFEQVVGGKGCKVWAVEFDRVGSKPSSLTSQVRSQDESASPLLSDQLRGDSHSYLTEVWGKWAERMYLQRYVRSSIWLAVLIIINNSSGTMSYEVITYELLDEIWSISNFAYKLPGQRDHTCFHILD